MTSWGLMSVRFGWASKTIGGTGDTTITLDGTSITDPIVGIVITVDTGTIGWIFSVFGTINTLVISSTRSTFNMTRLTFSDTRVIISIVTWAIFWVSSVSVFGTDDTFIELVTSFTFYGTILTVISFIFVLTFWAFTRWEVFSSISTDGTVINSSSTSSTLWSTCNTSTNGTSDFFSNDGRSESVGYFITTISIGVFTTLIKMTSRAVTSWWVRSFSTMSTISTHVENVGTFVTSNVTNFTEKMTLD